MYCRLAGKSWPLHLGCIHPGVLGGADAGANVIMEEFYNQYWSEQLEC